MKQLLWMDRANVVVGSHAVENACQTTKDGRSEMSWMMTVYGRATGQQG